MTDIDKSFVKQAQAVLDKVDTGILSSFDGNYQYITDPWFLDKIREALTLLAEVEEGKAHVMRWENIEKAKSYSDQYGDTIGFYRDDGYHAEHFAENLLLSHIDEGAVSFATFNGEPEIPKPEGE